jgi:hypothetical protein
MHCDGVWDFVWDGWARYIPLAFHMALEASKTGHKDYNYGIAS